MRHGARQLYVLRLLAVLVCIPLLAQQPPQQRTPSIAGTVVAARDEQPVKRAEVILRPATAGALPLGVTTDERGRFAFYDVPGGSYDLHARHDGFLFSTYVLHRGARLPLPFAYEAGQALDAITLRLPAAAVLAGKVQHSDGDPATGTAVEAYRGYYNRGRFIYETTGRTLTNDRGEYRLYNLPPGQYYLAAVVASFRDAPANLQDSYPTDFAGTPIPPQRSVTTFYPSAWKVSEAAEFSVGLGAEMTNMDITLARTRAATVLGRAISSQTGRPVQGAAVQLVRPDSRQTGFLPARFQTKPLQDGTFEIRGVVPGTYYIEAGASEERKPVRARQLLVVAEVPEVKVDVVLMPELTLDGVVRLEGAAPIYFSDIRVTAEPRVDAASKTAAVKADGTFTLPLLPGIEYDLVLTSAPDDVYLKAARLESLDVLAQGLVASPSTSVPLELVLDRSGAQLHVLTQPGANVLLMPSDGRLEKYQSASGGQYGFFTFRGVAPGNYRVLAWFDTPPCEVHDPMNRAACDSFGSAVAVSAGGRHAVELEPTDKIPTSAQ